MKGEEYGSEPLFEGARQQGQFTPRAALSLATGTRHKSTSLIQQRKYPEPRPEGRACSIPLSCGEARGAEHSWTDP